MDEPAHETPRILLIDDDPFARAFAAGVLASAGFEIIEATSGQEGLALAQAQRPLLVVCDIEMPGLDGYATLQAMRQNPTTCDVPFIFLTVHDDRDAMRRGMELGADDYLTKPFNAEELRKAVRTRLVKHARDTRAHQQDVEQHLTSILPHELRTPIQVVLGGAELLMDSRTDKNDPTIAATIHRAGERLHHLTENFLLSSGLSPARCRVEGACPHRLDDLTRLIESCARTVLARWNRWGDFTLAGRNAPVRTTEADFHKAFSELLDNAAKFSRPGTPIRVAIEPSGDIVQVTIADRGLGMDPNEVEQVTAFRQFERGKREQQGVGLGLWMACRLVERHDGTVRIASEPGVGTAVELRLSRAD
jgi:signal transduction histidine kinase